MKKIAAFALVALVLTGCSSAEKQEQQEQKFLHNETNLAAAQRNAAVNCDPANCDAAWALTKRYIEQHSDTTVTRADAVAIDTDVPEWFGQGCLFGDPRGKRFGRDLDSLCAVPRHVWAGQRQRFRL